MRDTTFSIYKALAIILVVLSHAGAPVWASRFVFQFHVPVFFICAGYFFQTKYLDDAAGYVWRRIKGLYFPFLRWSILFLILHNVFFLLGVLNEQYGNAAGGVLHPYDSLHIFSQRLVSIVFNMSGYDEFIGGTFWFFRALLLSSVAFLVLFKLWRRLRPDLPDTKVGLLIAGTALALTLWKVVDGWKITGVAQGGYRELMGVFFMSAGFLFRQYRSRIPLKAVAALPCLGLAVLGACCFPSSMLPSADFRQFVSLLLPSLGGAFFLYYVAVRIDAGAAVLRRPLTYIGERTLYVFAFHLLAFKLVSALKVGWYGLPWAQIGGHPVVNAHRDDYFFLLYVPVGVGLPLLWMAVYRHLAKRIDFSLKSRALWLLGVLFRLARILLRVAKCIARTVSNALQSLFTGIKDIVRASNPKDE